MVHIHILQAVTFKPDGTNDALHFYMNGVEKDIDVTVKPTENGTRSEFKCILV